MKNKWRKTTRVNGVVVQTLHLGNVTKTGDIRGVVVTFSVMHEKHGKTLTIELDGECPLDTADEAIIFAEAERLLQEAISLFQPPADT